MAFKEGDVVGVLGTRDQRMAFRKLIYKRRDA